MKKLLGIVVLGLLLSGNAYAKDDLIGKKLYCESRPYHMSFEFITNQFVKWIEVSPFTVNNQYFKEYKNKYKTTLDQITIDTNVRGKIYINRKNLKTEFLQCEVFELKKNSTMKKMMREMFDYYTKDNKSKNKI